MLDRGEEIDFEMTLEDLTDDAIATAKVTVEQLLKESRLRVLSLETVLSWMHKLGFKYETRKAHFYVDSHEKPEVKNIETASSYLDTSNENSASIDGYRFQLKRLRK